MTALGQFAIVERFLSREEAGNRSVSDYEKSILTMCRGDGDNEEDPGDDDDDPKNEDTQNYSSNNQTDKFYGIRLYARFHSYYENKTKGSDSFEDVHMKILEKLNDFSQVYIRSVNVNA